LAGCNLSNNDGAGGGGGGSLTAKPGQYTRIHLTI
jgi:hypothetical protein